MALWKSMYTLDAIGCIGVRSILKVVHKQKANSKYGIENNSTILVVDLVLRQAKNNK